MIFSTAPAEAPRDEVLQRTAVVQHHGITVDPDLGAGKWDNHGISQIWNQLYKIYIIYNYYHVL